MYINAFNVSGGKLKKIVERIAEGQKPLMTGAETVVFGNDGTMYVMSPQAKLLKLIDLEDQDDGVTIHATVVEVKDLGMGSPLGGKFSADGTLYIADTLLGLIRIVDPENPASKVELVASRVKVDGQWSPILYADDVTIGKSGKVYFSDASDFAPDWEGNRWDIDHSSKMDLARGKRAGRLLEYDPESDQVRVLASGIHFANGVAVDEQERFVMVVESFQARTLKYYLKGPKQGTLEPIDTFFPGFSDGMDCTPETGLCYVAVPTSPGAMRLVYMMPSPLDRYIRTILMTLPKVLVPGPPPFCGVVVVDPGDETKEQRVVKIMLDPKGEDIRLATGITARGNKLYLGFLLHEHIAVYDLDK